MTSPWSKLGRSLGGEGSVNDFLWDSRLAKSILGQTQLGSIQGKGPFDTLACYTVVSQSGRPLSGFKEEPKGNNPCPVFGVPLFEKPPSILPFTEAISQNTALSAVRWRRALQFLDLQSSVGFCAALRLAVDSQSIHVLGEGHVQFNLGESRWPHFGLRKCLLPGINCDMSCFHACVLVVQTFVFRARSAQPGMLVTHPIQMSHLAQETMCVCAPLTRRDATAHAGECFGPAGDAAGSLRTVALLLAFLVLKLRMS